MKREGVRQAPDLHAMEPDKTPPPIFIVSGGRGFAGNQLVQSLLVQFPQAKIPVKVEAQVRTDEQIEGVVDRALRSDGVIVHTMVDQRLRGVLRRRCRENGVREFDLVSGLENHLMELLHVKPINEPGLYRKLHQSYYDRIEALEFTVSCDDGLNTRLLRKADIILAGVSRSGKTPLSMYMTMFGWKVANVPIVKHIAPPPELFSVDRRRVFGLSISAVDLITHRRKRMQNYPSLEDAEYVNPEKVKEELDCALSIFRKGGFSIIDVSHKPIEATANEIIALMSERFDPDSRMQRLES